MSDDPRARRVVWRRTGKGEFPYDAEVDGHKWTVRINDFPAEPPYTLFIDGGEIVTFDDWPKAWVRPE